MLKSFGLPFGFLLLEGAFFVATLDGAFFFFAAASLSDLVLGGGFS